MATVSPESKRVRENVICMLFEREFSCSTWGEVIKYFSHSCKCSYMEKRVIKREMWLMSCHGIAYIIPQPWQNHGWGTSEAEVTNLLSFYMHMNGNWFWAKFALNLNYRHVAQEAWLFCMSFPQSHLPSTHLSSLGFPLANEFSFPVWSCLVTSPSSSPGRRTVDQSQPAWVSQ